MGAQQEKITQSIARFINSAPEESARIRIGVRSDGGTTIETMFELATAKVILSGAEQMGREIYMQTDQWAETSQRECTFVAQHLDGSQTVIGSTTWKIGGLLTNDVKLNGEVSSFMAQQQAHVHAVLSMHLQGFETLNRANRTIIELQAKRIAELERDRDQLRKQLDKRPEASSEDALTNQIAIEQMQAEGELKRLEQLGSAAAEIMRAFRGEPSKNPGGLAGAIATVTKEVANGAGAGNAAATSSAAAPATNATATVVTETAPTVTEAAASAASEAKPVIEAHGEST